MASDDNYKQVDPETHNRRRRLGSIQDARERVQKVVNESYGEYARNEINRFAALTQVRRAVEMYIYEVEGLIKSDDEYKQYYWTEVDLGELELPTQTVEFQGLQSIVHAPETIVDEWEEQRIDDVRGKRADVQRVKEQIPYEVLMAAYSAVNQFCTHAGIDLDFSDGLPTVDDFDQSGEASNARLGTANKTGAPDI